MKDWLKDEIIGRWNREIREMLNLRRHVGQIDQYPTSFLLYTFSLKRQIQYIKY